MAPRYYRKDALWRYYSLELGCDLFGTWVIVRSWGALDSRHGRLATSIYPDYAAAVAAFQAAHRRRLRRDYEWIR